MVEGARAARSRTETVRARPRAHAVGPSVFEAVLGVEALALSGAPVPQQLPGGRGPELRSRNTRGGRHTEVR